MSYKLLLNLPAMNYFDYKFGGMSELRVINWSEKIAVFKYVFRFKEKIYVVKTFNMIFSHTRARQPYIETRLNATNKKF